MSAQTDFTESLSADTLGNKRADLQEDTQTDLQEGMQASDNLTAAVKGTLQADSWRCIISNPRQKDGPVKIHIRKALIKGQLLFQSEEQLGTQVFHHNHTGEEITAYIVSRLLNSFKQGEIFADEDHLLVLVSKRGKVTIKRKKMAFQKIKPDCVKNTLEHNRTKNYIIKEGVPVPFLRDLGVMDDNGRIVRKMYDKFRQINRFLEFIRDISGELPRDREIKIIDFGCGKSYLTFAIYYYLHELNGLDVRITGLDLKKEVIEHCNRLSEQYGYDKLVFKRGDIADYESEGNVDMVVTLHACDTATDYALYKAVSWKAKVILSVPCCQHELNRQIKNELLQPVLSYGILKERMAAILTDAIRAEMLAAQGYHTEILEFIDMEHTPKNLLIRAVWDGKCRDTVRLAKMIEEMQVTPTIVELLHHKK